MPVTVPIRINSEDNNDLAHQLFFEFLAPQRLYVFGFEGVGGPSIFKSLDGGATWAAQDDGNIPGYNVGSWDAVQSGTKLYVCGTGAHVGQHINIIPFDTATDTWGTEVVGPTFFNSPPEGAATVRIVKVASGDIWAFIDKSSGSNARDSIGYAIFSGGAWSGVTNFVVDNATPTFNFIQQVVVDSANLIHVIYKKNTFGDMNASLYHRTVTVGGVISAEQAIQVPFTPYNCGRAVAWVNPVSLVESIVVPYYDSASNLAGVWMGTPASAPVWTFTLVDTLGWPAGYTDYGLAQAGRGSAYAFVSGVNLYLAWASHDPTYAVVNAIYFAKNDGNGWGAPTIYYDEVANPPSWAGDFIEEPELYADSLIFLNDGTISGTSNINCVGVGFLPPAQPGVPPVGDCANPPDGTVGRPYSHAFTATGGTMPYTFAITAGTLPTGVSLSPDGTAAGTPTASGIFSFEVTVTDAAALSNSFDCSITIRPKQYFFGSAEQLVCDVKYPWSIPPEQRTPWKQENSITAPAVGVQGEIWAYLIPDNFYLVLDRIRHFYGPAGFVLGAGSIIWSIDIDTPIGSPLATQRPISQFTNSIGSPDHEPFPVGPLQIRGGSTVRYKVLIADPTVPTGPPNIVAALAEGWLYPVTRSGN